MAVIQVILTNGEIADANEVMDNFDEIYTNITNVNIAASAGIVFSKLDSATVAGVSASQNLTNKTLTASILAGTFTGTYTLAGTPTITSPTITNPVITGNINMTGTLAVGSVTIGPYQFAASSTGREAGFFQSTEAGAGYGIFDLYRNSVLPVVNDEVFSLRFMGNQANGSQVMYSRIMSVIDATTNGAQTGHMDFIVASAGSEATPLKVTSTGVFLTTMDTDPPADIKDLNSNSIVKVAFSIGVSGASAGSVSGYNVVGVTVSSWVGTVEIDTNLADVDGVGAVIDGTANDYFCQVHSIATTEVPIGAIDVTGANVTTTWGAYLILS